MSLALCEVNPLVTGGFPSQRVRNAVSVSMSWRHYEKKNVNSYMFMPHVNSFRDNSILSRPIYKFKQHGLKYSRNYGAKCGMLSQSFVNQLFHCRNSKSKPKLGMTLTVNVPSVICLPDFILFSATYNVSSDIKLLLVVDNISCCPSLAYCFSGI